jgi:hypothetical protein
MDVQVAVLCDSAADYNGKLCVLGAFDTIGVRQLPAVHPHCSIALRIVFRDDEEGPHQFKLTLIDEDGRSLLPKMDPALEVRMPPNMFFVSSNIVFNLQGMKFEKTGQYSIDVTLDGKMIARIPLQVIMLQPTAGA